MMFGSTQPELTDSKWRQQLDRFVKANQLELAALAWGLWSENGNNLGTIGIDFKLKPHFVYCSQAAIEILNDKVENRLQEVLGLIKHHKPEVEVLMLGIGREQVKLIYFEPQPAPPICLEQVGMDLDSLIKSLEQRMSQEITYF
jgi:hypothetical protein